MRSPTARVSGWDTIGSATFSGGTTAEQEGTAEGDPSVPETPRTETNASSTGQEGRTVRTEENRRQLGRARNNYVSSKATRNGC